jgi:hypothetical protein
MPEKKESNIPLAVAAAAAVGFAAYKLLAKPAAGLKLDTVTPATARQGETIDTLLNGLGFTNVTRVSFGQGITVNNFAIESNLQIIANITIAGTATIGKRDISVSTKAGAYTLKAGFTVETVGVLQISGLTATYR